MGKLSDLYGRRRLLVACLVGFMAGSVLCALAPTMPILIVARAVQGIGGGGLITLAQTIVADVVSPRERGRYAAYFSAVWASSSLLGPILGGVLAERLGWPWIFWINLPLGVTALLVAGRALRKLPVESHGARIDYAGSVLLAGGTIALLLALSLGGKRLAWASWESLGLFAASVLLFGLFARQQGQAAEPVLPPRFLRDGAIRPALVAVFIIYGAYLAVSVLAPTYFQVALGTSASEAGLLMIPLLLSSTLTANMAGRWSRRSGRSKRPPLVGLPVTIISLAIAGYFAADMSRWVASAVLMIAGFGVGPIFPCTTVAAQNAVERRDLGAVSGAIAFSRALGGAILIAAASALVLGLCAAALPETGQLSGLEDLARHELPPAARETVARAFGILFWTAAGAFALGLAVFALLEDRALREHAPIAERPAEPNRRAAE